MSTESKCPVMNGASGTKTAGGKAAGVPAGTIGRRSAERPGGKMVVFSYSQG